MLSQPQFKPQSNEMADTTKIGAMPIKNKYDGPAPLPANGNNGVAAPNKGMSIPKPGFF